MPELKLPEVKIPGFRDMNRDDIKHSLPDVSRPDIKLSDLDPRNIEMPKIDLSKIDLSKFDLAGAASAAAASAAEHNPLRKRRASRLPMVITGLVVAALGVFAILNISSLRARAEDLGRRAKEKLDAARVNDSLEHFDTLDEVGPVGIPVQGDPFSDTLPSAEETYREPGYGTPAGTLDTYESEVRNS
jgi:hypothetical protein